MTTKVAVEDEFAFHSECWCLGKIEVPRDLVRPAKHPRSCYASDACTGHACSPDRWDATDHGPSPGRMRRLALNATGVGRD